MTVLRAANLYGNVGAPHGETDPELVLLAQAEAWAAPGAAAAELPLIP